MKPGHYTELSTARYCADAESDRQEKDMAVVRDSDGHYEVKPRHSVYITDELYVAYATACRRGKQYRHWNL